MFDELSGKLDTALSKLRQRGVLTEPMIKEGLREVRRVLLEADVNYQVTRDFLDRVQERALGEAVHQGGQPRPADREDRARRAGQPHGRGIARR